MTIQIKIEKRSKNAAHKIREKGFVPAVFYGRKTEATPIQIKKSDFLKGWHKAGESSVVELTGDSNTVEALIQDVQLNPVSGEPIHADFYVFEKGHKVEISIPLEFTGESPAVRNLGAVLVKSLHELKIKAEPSKLPHMIEVDISSLENFGDVVSASSIKLPSGVELMENPEETIASVSEPKEEKEEEAVPVDLSQIEVEKKGKQEEEGATETLPEEENSKQE